MRAPFDTSCLRGSSLALAITMKNSCVAACLLAFVAAAHADQSVIKGKLRFNSTGFGLIAECGTGRVIEFGVMPSGPYFLLTRRYEELAGEGDDDKPVLVEVEGLLTSSSTGKLVLQSPRVVRLQSGACGNG
jgi:hypothetical protein